MFEGCYGLDLLDAATVCGMEIYVDEGLAPGKPEIVSPEEALWRHGRPRC
jgi:hypothetical protein